MEEKIVDHVQILIDKFSTFFYDSIERIGNQAKPSEEEMSKAAAWYAVSYYDDDTASKEMRNKMLGPDGFNEWQDRLVKEFPQKFFGLPWFVVKHIMFKIRAAKDQVNKIDLLNGDDENQIVI